jgi:ABC-type Fe3+-hydroxamate transport system substrate-binding protein
MQSFNDQLGRKIELPYPPKRIVSLVPSQTELLFYLGLNEEVVGITKFCIHPREQFKKKKKVGGTKQLHLDWIEALEPDLIIGNKEENEKEQIKYLAERFPLWLSDIYTLEDAYEMIEGVGRITAKEKESQKLVTELKKRFGALHNIPEEKLKKAAYFIWRKPLMAVGKDTFIDHMLKVAGFTNAFSHLVRYPEVSPEQVRNASPDVILLSSEPYPFKEKHFAEFKAICPETAVKIVDGEMFSWYGSRLLYSAEYFERMRLGV